MAVKMAPLDRTKRSYTSRKLIPTGILETYRRTHGLKSWEERLNLPGHLSPSEAKARHNEQLAEIETRIANLRAATNGEAQSLTRLGAFALAGRQYSWFVEHHERDLGLPLARALPRAAGSTVFAKGHVMSKRGNDNNNIFRASDSPLTEYEKEQIAQRKNLERLRAERLAREAANAPKTKKPPK